MKIFGDGFSPARTDVAAVQVTALSEVAKTAEIIKGNRRNQIWYESAIRKRRDWKYFNLIFCYLTFSHSIPLIGIPTLMPLWFGFSSIFSSIFSLCVFPLFFPSIDNIFWFSHIVGYDWDSHLCLYNLKVATAH